MQREKEMVPQIPKLGGQVWVLLCTLVHRTVAASLKR